MVLRTAGGWRLTPLVQGADGRGGDGGRVGDGGSGDKGGGGEGLAGDESQEDHGIGPQCAPGEGCFLDKCEENDDCQSGWCGQHMGEGVFANLWVRQETTRSNRGCRGALPARRDDEAYQRYGEEEQRRRKGCIGVRIHRVIS